MHGATELGKGFEAAIKRQLGLKYVQNMFYYPVTLNPDGGTVLVTFADVPEAITFGADEDEALLNAVDALETGLSFYVDARLPCPLSASPRAGKRRCARRRWSAPNWGFIRQ